MEGWTDGRMVDGWMEGGREGGRERGRKGGREEGREGGEEGREGGEERKGGREGGGERERAGRRLLLEPQSIHGMHIPQTTVTQVVSALCSLCPAWLPTACRRIRTVVCPRLGLV